jgi:phage FluMu protein Com
MYLVFKCPHCRMRQGEEVDTIVELDGYHSGSMLDVSDEEHIECPTCKTQLVLSFTINEE